MNIDRILDRIKMGRTTEVAVLSTAVVGAGVIVCFPVVGALIRPQLLRNAKGQFVVLIAETQSSRRSAEVLTVFSAILCGLGVSALRTNNKESARSLFGGGAIPTDYEFSYPFSPASRAIWSI